MTMKAPPMILFDKYCRCIKYASHLRTGTCSYHVKYESAVIFAAGCNYCKNKYSQHFVCGKPKVSDKTNKGPSYTFTMSNGKIQKEMKNERETTLEWIVLSIKMFV